MVVVFGGWCLNPGRAKEHNASLTGINFSTLRRNVMSNFISHAFNNETINLIGIRPVAKIKPYRINIYEEV